MTSKHVLAPSRPLANKVPEITVYFWVIKVLCTTIGESAADFLNINLNLGLSGTSVVTGVLLVLALVLQFRADRYVPSRYWLAVTLVSVFGTLVTDNLTDQVGLPLEVSTLVFAALLGVTFSAWYRAERTLSIHSICTVRRESFYWTAILVTFALGTATGDLMAEVLGLGYLVTGLIVAAMITLTALAWRFGLHPVLSFWIIYVLTRPLGASIGDYLSQPRSQGGLGLGATATSLIFVVAILAIVAYLSVSKIDLTPSDSVVENGEAPRRGGLPQTVVVVALVLLVAGAGYAWRTSSLRAATTDPAIVVQAGPVDARSGSAAGPPAGGGQQPAQRSPLGDLSTFRVITQDTLDRLNAGDQAGATARVDDLEVEWDNAEARLKPKDKAAWTEIDGKIDTVLRELRSTNPEPGRETAALETLLSAL
jgi:uncharacterized membrane-anchored protein